MLAHHVKKLVLTPQLIDGQWVYSVAGEWELLPGSDCVIWVVARDGIEPPTPAFSGPRSTTELSGQSVQIGVVGRGERGFIHEQYAATT